MAAIGRHRVGCIAALLVLLLTLGCGTGGDSPGGASMRVGTVANVGAGPGGLPGLIPSPFEVTGDDFSEIVSAECTVRFRAVDATPFENGTSATAEVPGVITPNRLVIGTSPLAAVCGTESISTFVMVRLPSGFARESEEPIAVFLAPRIDSLSRTTVPAETPTDIEIATSLSAAPDGDPNVIVHWSSTDPVFAGGTATTATTPGTWAFGGAVSTTTPVVAACGAGDPPVMATLEKVEFANGACTPPGDAVPMSFLPPVITGYTPTQVQGGDPSPFSILGEGLGVAGDAVTLYWESDDAIFDSGAAMTATSSGTVLTPLGITGQTPEVTFGDVDVRTARITRIEFAGGSCATPPANTMRFARGLSDVLDQMANMQLWCERLGFHPPEAGVHGPGTPAGWLDGTVSGKSHWQGMARVDYGGKPYMIVALAGRGCVDGNPLCDLTPGGEIDPSDSRWPGHLYIVDFESRRVDKDSVWAGERLRSNRLTRDDELIAKTAPPTTDRIVFDHVEGETDPNTGDFIAHYRHPGGVQIVDNLLVVPYEAKNENLPGLPTGKVVFYDLGSIFDDETGWIPGATLQQVHEIAFDHKVGALGITKLKDGRYLMMLGAYDSGKGLKFLVADETDVALWPGMDPDGGEGATSVFRPAGLAPSIAAGSKVIFCLTPVPVSPGVVPLSGLPDPESAQVSANFQTRPDFFDPTDSWTFDYGESEKWPVETPIPYCLVPYRFPSTFQIFQLLTQEDGQVFCVAMRNSRKDHVRPTDSGKDLVVVYRLLEQGSRQPIATNRWGAGDLVVHMEAALELQQYGTHPGETIASNSDNHGSFNGACAIHVSPTGQLILYSTEHFKGANAEDPETVQMGEWRDFRATRFQPSPTLETSWVELFATLNDGVRDEVDRSLIIDYLDWNTRPTRYADFRNIEGNGLNEFSDDTSGVHWCLPVGTSVFLYEDDNWRGKVLELRGTGKIEEIRDLDKLEEVTKARGDIVRGYESDGTRVANNDDGGLGFDFDGKTSAVRFGDSR